MFTMNLFLPSQQVHSRGPPWQLEERRGRPPSPWQCCHGPWLPWLCPALSSVSSLFHFLLYYPRGPLSPQNPPPPQHPTQGQSVPRLEHPVISIQGEHWCLSQYMLSLLGYYISVSLLSRNLLQYMHWGSYFEILACQIKDNFCKLFCNFEVVEGVNLRIFFPIPL